MERIRLTARSIQTMTALAALSAPLWLPTAAQAYLRGWG